jgi:hypothetical protein
MFMSISKAGAVVLSALFIVAGTVGAADALSQEEADPSSEQSPKAARAFCEDNPGFDDFDFWVGEWNVYTNDEARKFAGTNSITKHHANCLLKESWVDTAGNDGFSINYYNPLRSEWRQVWVANGYSIDYTGGLNDKGAMVLEGHLDSYGPGTSQPFRGIWTPQDNGDVVQHFDVLNPETGEWDVWFEGRYVRKESDPNPPRGNSP